MSTTATLKPGNQLRGSYHTDRKNARVMGDLLRIVVETPTKVAAEEAASQQTQEFPLTPSRGIRI